MEFGYKARSLMRIKEKGLPSLQWIILDGTSVSETVEKIHLFMDACAGRWVLRTDAPVKPVYPTLLPLYCSNKGSDPEKTAYDIYTDVCLHPDYNFVLSEGPDDATRDANIVCWRDGDYLFGEIGFEPITLRDAWVRGHLHPFVITGGPGDVLRQRQGFSDRQYIYMTPEGMRLESMQYRLDYLRKIRELICDEDYEYEVSVCSDGRLIFWQDLPLTEDRKYLMNNLFF